MSLRSLGLSKDPKDAQRQPSCFPDVQGRKFTVSGDSGPLPIQKNLELQDLNLSCCNDAQFTNF